MNTILQKSLLLKPLISLNNFDFICLSKSYLDSTTSSDDKNLCLDGYKLIRTGHPKNIKQGGSCIYYSETLPVKIIQLNYLLECLVCEINYDNNKFSSLLCIDLPVNQPMSLISFFVVLKM